MCFYSNSSRLSKTRFFTNKISSSLNSQITDNDQEQEETVMAKPKFTAVNETEDSPQEIGGYIYHCWKFTNPFGAKVRCEAKSGTGEISLYKNNKIIGPQY